MNKWFILKCWRRYALRTLVRGAGFELNTPLTGYLLCLFLRFHCLATARLFQTKQKSLKAISVRGACSYHNAVFTHAMAKTAVNNCFIDKGFGEAGVKTALR